MKGAFPWSLAIRLAWRDTRASVVKFFFVIFAVAVGVGSLIGVRGFSESFNEMLDRESQKIIASDVSLRVFALPDADQQKVLHSLEKPGVAQTWVTETITMAARNGENPVLVSAKAIDPTVFPFYGQVKLSPDIKLADALQEDTCVVAEDLLVRMNVKVGDTIFVGGQGFRIAASITKEPDRMAGSLNVGLRLMLSRAGLERTGLIRFGSRASQRFLFKINPTQAPIKEVRQALMKAFPEGQVIDGTEANPTITSGLQRATIFLSLISLIALVVGALGVAMAMRAHLQQRLDTIAIMKSLGGSSAQIMQIYLLQTLLLGVVGGLFGVVVGAGVQALFPLLIRKYFEIDGGLQLHAGSIFQGLAIGVLTTLLFTLPTLLSVREIKPLLIFRRDMAGSHAPWWKRWKSLIPSWIASAIIIGGMGAIAGYLAKSGLLGAYFAAGVVVSLLLLAATAWLLLRLLKWLLKSPRQALPAVVRHGLANLYRPGNQAGAVLVALGVGVVFTLTVYMVQKSFLNELAESLPASTPNVFLIDVLPDMKDGLLTLLAQQKGIQGKPELVPSVAALVTEVDGHAIKDMKLDGPARRFKRTRTVSFSATKLEGLKVLKGQWWSPDSAQPVISISEDAAKNLNAKLGSHIIFEAFGKRLDVTIAAIHKVESFRIGAAAEFIFTPATLAGLPTIYFGAIHVDAKQVPYLQRAIYQRYPTVSVVNINEVLDVIQEVIDQIAIVVRFISAFAILAGIIILASSVAGTRFRRIRETVILKSLGGTRRKIASIFSVEFLILGATAGIMGSMIATAFSSIILVKFLEGQLLLRPGIILSAITMTALVALIAGWLASLRILSQKPLEVLREE